MAFLQGGYGYRDRNDGRMLRHVVGDDGVPGISSRGQPLLSVGGAGPVVELQFTGTGFLVGTEGTLVTNRHVALPWEQGAAEVVAGHDGLEPVMLRFVSYLPGETAAVPVTLVRASETADIALLRRDGTGDEPPGLELAGTPPLPGEEVIVMGFPTGLRSMIAQSGKEFVEALRRTRDTDFWKVAERLAAGGHVAPLASRGIVARQTASVVVYDAETASGGSGGPVLNRQGHVIAVNAAVLPEYGGSNLGVPVAKLKALLEANVAN